MADTTAGVSSDSVAVHGARSLRRWLSPRRLARAWWREARLRVGDLPPAVRNAVWALIGVIAATTVLLAFTAFGVGLPGGLVGVPSLIDGTTEPVAVAFIVLLWAALAVIASASLLLASLPAARRPRLVLLAVGLVTLVFMSGLVVAGDTMHSLEQLGLAEGGLAAWRVAHGVGWAGVAIALLTISLPLSVLRSHAAVAVVVGAAPYMGGLLLTLVGGGAVYRFDLAVTGMGSATAQALAARPFIDAAFLLSVALVLTIYWQTATWARAGRRDFGLRVAAGVRRWVVFGWLLLLAKLVFIGVGYAGAAACSTVGDTSSVWTNSLCDGQFSWAIAVVFALAVGVWLLRPERLPISDRHLVRVAAVLVAGFSIGTLAIAATSVPLAVLTLLEIRPPISVVDFPDCLSVAATDGLHGVLACAQQAAGALSTTQLAPAGTIVAMLVGGLVLMLRPSYRALGVPMVIFGAWGLQRAVDPIAKALGADLPEQSIGIQLVSFDTALTVLLCAVAVLAWRHRDAAVQAAVALVLVVSTLAAHGPTLLPRDIASSLAPLLLAVPALYLIMLDARGLNRPSVDRPLRVLRAVIVAALLLVMAATGITLSAVDPDIHGDLATLLFLVPFAAVLVGTTLTTRLATGAATRAPAGAA